MPLAWARWRTRRCPCPASSPSRFPARRATSQRACGPARTTRTCRCSSTCMAAASWWAASTPARRCAARWLTRAARPWAATAYPPGPEPKNPRGREGGRDTCAAMCSQVAHQSGAAVVAIDYRLAPEHKYPAGLEDCMAALRWLAEHGHTKHLDASRPAVGGGSAGGTLAAILAVLARDADIPLKLQALFYPSVQVGVRTESFMTYGRATFLNAELMKWFENHAQGGHLSERWHREPLHAPDHRDVAPAWIGLAQCDPLTDDGYLYADKLRAAGVPVELQVWPGVIHDFINMRSEE